MEAACDPQTLQVRLGMNAQHFLFRRQATGELGQGQVAQPLPLQQPQQGDEPDRRLMVSGAGIMAQTLRIGDHGGGLNLLTHGQTT